MPGACDRAADRSQNRGAARRYRRWPVRLKTERARALISWNGERRGKHGERPSDRPTRLSESEGRRTTGNPARFRDNGLVGATCHNARRSQNSVFLRPCDGEGGGEGVNPQTPRLPLRRPRELQLPHSRTTSTRAPADRSPGCFSVHTLAYQCSWRVPPCALVRQRGGWAGAVPFAVVTPLANLL